MPRTLHCLKRTFEFVLSELRSSCVDSCFVADSIPVTNRNAMRYYPVENCVYETAKDLDANFLEIVSEFKTDQIKSAKKSFSNATAKPNSSVAAILERKARRDLISSMIPSAATLLVVPNTLLDHWEVSHRFLPYMFPNLTSQPYRSKFPSTSIPPIARRKSRLFSSSLATT